VPTVAIAIATWIAAVIGTGVAIPQLVALVRNGGTAGLSVSGWVNGSIDYLGWVILLAGTGAWGLLAATVPAGLLWTATTVLLLSRRDAPTAQLDRILIVGYATALVALSVVGVTYSWWPLGAVLAVSIIWIDGPAVVELWRASDLRAVAAAGWVLAVIEGAAYAIAGWGRIPAVVYGLGAVGITAVGLSRLVYVRRRA